LESQIMHLATSALLLLLTGIVLLAAIRHASRTFRRIYIDQSGDMPSPTRLLWSLAWNYFTAILTFTQVYRILFILDPDTFNVPLQLFDGFYFSVITISSTGFGDIFPKSTAAKLAVCTEIVFGYFLTVILFSSFAGLAFRKRANISIDKNSDRLT
jgi:hypothetical protein